MTDCRQFKQHLEQLQEVITSGLAFFAVWKKLQLYDEGEVPWSIDRQNQVLGRWNGFFTPVGIALQRMAMLEFAKVFDGNKQTVSLPNLLSQARQQVNLVPHAQQNDLTEISSRLRKAKATRETLRKLRNQRLAHADARPGPLPPLMSQQMDSLIEDIKFAFNRLSVAHDGSFYSWEMALNGINRDTTAILSLLLSEVERSKIEFDDRMVEIVAGHIEGMEATLGCSLDDGEIASVVREYALTPEQERRVREARGPRIPKGPLEG